MHFRFLPHAQCHGLPRKRTGPVTGSTYPVVIRVTQGGIDFSRLVLCLLDREGQGHEVLRAMGALADRTAAPNEPTNTAFLLPVEGIQLF